MRRWVILEHRIAKNNIQGRHFDLLLEEKDSCRTWRMDKIPLLDGPGVKVTRLKPHQIYWLDRKEAYISGGRGWAKQVEAGFYSGTLSQINDALISISIYTKSFSAILEVNQEACRIFSI